MSAILGFLARLLRPLIAPLIAYWKGRSDAKRKAQIDDYENADDIRTRVSRDLPSELRKYQDRGYRDDK